MKTSDDARELIFELHTASGEPPIGGRVWYCRLDEQWEIWVNGNLKEPTTKVADLADVGPGDVYVQFNGWPAGVWNMVTGEGVIAAGSVANYGTFCDALRKARSALAGGASSDW